ncbi:MAG: hypothetical protein EOM05_03530 [Clostridia bacterium]|nr:hypothetical protein [Clostridia bacterium]
MKKQALISLFIAFILMFAACSKEESSPTLDFGDCAEYGQFGDTITNEDGQQGLIDPTQKVEADIDGNTTPQKAEGKSIATVDTTSVAKDGSIKVSWESVLGATSYNIYRATSQDGDYKELSTVTTTTYTDKSAESGKKYYYKIIAVMPTTTQNSKTTTKSQNTTTTTTKVVTPGFVGSSLKFTNQNDSETLLSSMSNNTYVAKIKSDYAKSGIAMADGHLVYVAITGNTYRYVFQFANTSTWNDTTLMQVQIFIDEVNYFSFFTMESGSAEYLAAKKSAEQKWQAMQEENEPDASKRESYETAQARFLAMSKDENFQTLHNKSFN